MRNIISALCLKWLRRYGHVVIVDDDCYAEILPICEKHHQISELLKQM